MRILMLSPTLGSAFGQERVMRDAAALLRSQGYQVFFFGETQSGALPPCDGYKLLPELAALNWLSPMTRLQPLLEKTYEWLDSIQPDVLHFIDQFEARFMSALIERCPSVMTSHTVATTCPNSTRLIHPVGICERKSGWACLLGNLKYGCLQQFKSPLHQAHAIEEFRHRRKALKKVQKIAAISRYVEKTLLHDGWPKSQVTLLYDPVEVMEPGIARPVPEKFHIAVASRLVPHKGVETLIRAVAQFSFSDWQLSILGDGPERARLEKLTEELGLLRHVQFHGALSYESAQEIIFRSSVLVQPNLGPEPFGLSPAEASAMGVPVVISDLPALTEIIVDGENGLVVPPGDWGKLSEALVRIKEDPELCSQLSIAGPNRMRRLFSDEKHLELTIKLYNEAINSFKELPHISSSPSTTHPIPA